MSYTFRWDKPASEVFVTGTFDDWEKSVKLEQTGTAFQKTVSLPSSSDKIYYKFVVDGDWTTSSDAPSEKDDSGNVNNVLKPEDISRTTEGHATNPTLSSVAPGSSTAAMAGAQPLEERSSPPAPGAFPEIPENENQTFSVNPIPASEGSGNPISLAPGEKMPDQSEISTNTVQSGVHDDPELKSRDEANNQTMSVNPIPASGGAGNPIHLAPGEKVPDPSEVTGNTVESTARTDAASYDKSDAGITQLQPDPKEDPVAAGLGPQSSSQIPESSMGMGKDAPSDINKEDTGPTISSVAPTSTTNEMAGQVPKEERREPTVIDEEKSDNKGVTGAIVGGTAAAGATIAGGAYAANELAKDKTGTDPKSALPESVQKTVDDNALQSSSSIPQQTAAGEAPKVPAEDNDLKPHSSVPEEVTKSQKEAQFPPEAAANSEAIEEKKEVEDELLNKVPESDAKGEPAPTASASAATTAPTATDDSALTAPGATNLAVADPSTSASGAPQLGDPTAGVAALSMDDKAGKDKPLDSRDVSPMSRPATNAQPKDAEAGKPTPRPQKATEASTPAKRQSMADRMKGTPGSAQSAGAETSDSKKEKRRSFFGRIKDKLKN